MEEVYQYLWQHRMWHWAGTRLVDGRSFELLDPGRLNRDAGPDFFNGKIKIEGTEWAGNIEIHVKASDWYRHGHDKDPAYANVVLHVVALDDARVARPDGAEVPQVVMTFPKEFFDLYGRLAAETPALRCGNRLMGLDPLVVTDWLESLVVERLQTKASRIAAILEATGGDWEQACFATLARGLGFGLNAEPFELLGRNVPLKIAHRHCDDLFQIEAILFGQAGMLDPSAEIFNDYYQGLCREYAFLLRKYGLRPFPASYWKYARTRPQNFPHRRIALLAKTLEGGFQLLRSLLEARCDADDIRQLFSWRLSGYWHDHFSFSREARIASDSLSDPSINLLLINVAAPIYYAYGSLRGEPQIADRALELLSQLPPERNSVIRQWAAAGIEATDAARSQALLQLTRQYCETRKCMYCRIGHRLLRRAAKPEPSCAY